MVAIDKGKHRIDESSQVILQVLRDRGGESMVRPLRDAADLDDNSSVHYRVKNKLIPAGLVEERGEKEVEGRKNPKLYGLTSEGRRWLDDHTEDVTKAVDAAVAVERLKETRRTVDRLSRDVRQLGEKYDKRTDTVANHSARLSHHGDRLKELKQLILDNTDEIWNDLNGRMNRIDQVNQKQEKRGKHRTRRLNEVDDRLDELEDEIESIREDVDRIDERTSDYDGLVDAVAALQTQVRAQGREIGEVRETAETTFWDRVLPWR